METHVQIVISRLLNYCVILVEKKKQNGSQDEKNRKLFKDRYK